MTDSFTKKHPWLTTKIKIHLWNFIGRIKTQSFIHKYYGNELKIIIDPNDDSVGKFIFLGNYEKETVSFIARYINSGDTVVDVGANIGFFSLIFSYLVGKNGVVHSFEPSQREFLHLCENIVINKSKNIFLNQIALSNENGFFEMNVLNESKFGAYNSLRKITHSKVQTEELHIENVRTIKFDDYITLFPQSIPTLIKIDVEGFERQVLEGMQSLLQNGNCPCLVIEICEKTHKGDQGGAQELISYIEGFGYKLFSPDTMGNLAPFNIGPSLNCIALKEPHLMYASKRGIKVAG